MVTRLACFPRPRLPGVRRPPRRAPRLPGGSGWVGMTRRLAAGWRHCTSRTARHPWAASWARRGIRGTLRERCQTAPSPQVSRLLPVIRAGRALVREVWFTPSQRLALVGLPRRSRRILRSDPCTGPGLRRRRAQRTGRSRRSVLAGWPRCTQRTLRSGPCTGLDPRRRSGPRLPCQRWLRRVARTWPRTLRLPIPATGHTLAHSAVNSCHTSPPWPSLQAQPWGGPLALTRLATQPRRGERHHRRPSPVSPSALTRARAIGFPGLRTGRSPARMVVRVAAV